MIGNDIIDLVAARRESNWQRPGFLHKLFTDKERGIIESSVHPDSRVWLLWSMKESAYKAWMQQGGKRFFGPKKIRCQLEYKVNDYKTIGSVTIENNLFHTQSILTESYIYTSTAKQDDSTIYQTEFQVFKIGKGSATTKSQIAHATLMDYYAKQKKVSSLDLSLEKSNTGVPFLRYKKQKLDLSISLTHHGDYGAFGWLETSSVHRLP